MNALSGKVLKEVQSSLLIMELDRERVVSVEEDASERKGFWDRANLCLGAIETD